MNSDLVAGAVTSLAGVAVGGFVTVRVARYQHQEELRARAARAVAQVQVLLNEADPDFLSATNATQVQTLVEGLWARASVLAGDVRAVTIENTGEIAEKSSELATAVVTALNRTHWFLLGTHNPAHQANYDASSALEDAQAKHADAVKLADELADLIRRL
jgi:hypothetical protein